MVEQIRKVALLMTSPGKVSEEHIPLLEDVLDRYPYSQPFHLLMSKAKVGNPSRDEVIASTSIYVNGSALHKFLFNNIPINRVEAESIDIEEKEENEIYDEISEVDIHQYHDLKLPTSKDIPAAQIDDFGIENIVATDFFAFENRFIEDQEPEQVVSKYDDDKLPYTFLWWLAKTRKEHQQIFQPYVTTRKPTSDHPEKYPPGNIPPSTENEFQQQYVEHIFHIQTPFTAEEHLASDADDLPASGKGKELIENFIRKDPQIRVPKPEQIDTENKARKSAEDHHDLVSETLAKIYIEQMLYQKAIDTYEKLSLKFPEKSRYFADLIQSINKKI